MNNVVLKMASAMGLSIVFMENVLAQDLVYEPVNPSFGGNAFNSAHLLAIANAQNDFDRPEVETSTADDLDRFISSLQSRLLSSLSTQVANAIFGEDAQDEGTIQFGEQTISFVRGLDGIELTITDADGTTTVITIPTLQSTTNDLEDDGSENDGSGNDGSTKTDPNITLNSVTESNDLAELTNDQRLFEQTTFRPIQQPIQ